MSFALSLSTVLEVISSLGNGTLPDQTGKTFLQGDGNASDGTMLS
ncbi:MAG: hypothetical protein ACOH2R_23440 [Pseudomonas sp.]